MGLLESWYNTITFSIFLSMVTRDIKPHSFILCPCMPPHRFVLNLLEILPQEQKVINVIKVIYLINGYLISYLSDYLFFFVFFYRVQKRQADRMK